MPGGYDPTQYVTERVCATATDGIEVPISLVYKKEREAATARRRCLLYGYGSYGASMPVEFLARRG